MCLKLLYEVLEIDWTALFISYGCTSLKGGKNPFFEIQRKEMYSHTFKFRASCLKPSPEELQGSVPTSPYGIIYLVIVWWKIHLQKCHQRNQITMSSSKGGSSAYWCKKNHGSYSPPVTPAVEADSKWRMFRIHSVLEMCVFLHSYI